MSLRYVFNTSGDYVAFVVGDNIFDPDSDWLGFIRNGNEVYGTDGEFVGYLLEDDRVVRNRAEMRRMRLARPFRPMRPFRPFRPFRRLRMPRLPYPYEDAFETGKLERPG
jgi:glycosyltransferase involved in cell wall biosynthesis